MILRLGSGVEIENVKYFRTVPDYAKRRISGFAMVEKDDGEIVKVEIPEKELQAMSIKDDSETRFDFYN